MIELLHSNPRVLAALVGRAGIKVQGRTATVIGDSNLSARKPVTLTADLVTLHETLAGKLAIVTEVQKYPPKQKKRRAWAAYVAIAAVEHECDAVLIVIALRRDTARASARPIKTGHPGFELTPIVIGPDTPPYCDAPWADMAIELTVLTVLAGGLDLGDPEARMFMLKTLTIAEAGRRAFYTRLILETASAANRKALEETMKSIFRNDFVDGLLDQGRAEGEAKGEAGMLLRILAARGITVPDDIRDRVTSCSDTAQLEAWGELAATATSLREIFGT